jgi:hypothetical protein
MMNAPQVVVGKVSTIAGAGSNIRYIGRAGQRNRSDRSESAEVAEFARFDGGKSWFENRLAGAWQLAGA